MFLWFHDQFTFCILSPLFLLSSFCMFQISRMPSDVANFFMSTVRETMEYRERNNVHRNDFMELLIQLKNKGKIYDPDAIKPAEEENVLLSGNKLNKTKSFQNFLLLK